MPASDATEMSGISRVVQWVQATPLRLSVHVLLPGKFNDAETRVVQRRLLAMGCQVTARYAH
jgi:hypothetical protein